MSITDTPELPAGWTLAHSGPDVYRLEKTISGKSRSAVGGTLAHAITDAQDLEARLEAHPSMVRSAYGNPTNPKPSAGGSNEIDQAAPRYADESPPSQPEAMDLTAGRDV
jgi:hypothetical protein